MSVADKITVTLTRHGRPIGKTGTSERGAFFAFVWIYNSMSIYSLYMNDDIDGYANQVYTSADAAPTCELSSTGNSIVVRNNAGGTTTIRACVIKV